MWRTWRTWRTRHCRIQLDETDLVARVEASRNPGQWRRAGLGSVHIGVVVLVVVLVRVLVVVVVVVVLVVVLVVVVVVDTVVRARPCHGGVDVKASRAETRHLDRFGSDPRRTTDESRTCVTVHSSRHWLVVWQEESLERLHPTPDLMQSHYHCSSYSCGDGRSGGACVWADSSCCCCC